MKKKKKKIQYIQCVMTTPETKEVHCLYCMQKQLKARHEFSGLLQICTHLQQRPMSCSNIQQNMVQELHKCTKTWRKASRIQNFSEWSRGRGKSHIVHLIQRDMSIFFKHTVKPDDDQPIVLITVPTGSAAFQIHSAFLLHDNFQSKPSWEKRTQMQLKLEHIMLSITDEISMVGFKQFQSMN